MIIKIKNQLYEVSNIFINQQIQADDLKKIKKLSIEQHPHIDILLIKKKLDKIKKKLKIEFLNLILNESEESVNIEYITKGSNILSATITFNMNYCFILKSTDEMMAIIFHEIGHLLDEISLQKQLNKNFFLYVFFNKTLLFTSIISNFYLYIQQDFQKLIVANLIFTLLLFINWIFNKIKTTNINKNNEFMADYHGAALLGNPITYIGMLTTLHNQFGDKYSDSHPELSRRILFIKQNFWFRILIIRFLNFFPFKSI